MVRVSRKDQRENGVGRPKIPNENGSLSANGTLSWLRAPSTRSIHRRLFGCALVFGLNLMAPYSRRKPIHLSRLTIDLNLGAFEGFYQTREIRSRYDESPVFIDAPK